MDKNAIKKYAVWARRELISRVTQRALKYGISEKEIIPAKETSIHGVALSPTEIAQRTALIGQISNKGFEQVMEEVAYTWFNRFSALRFMEVNGYLPTHVRVFTDDENNFKPQIMAEAINLEMDGLDMEKVYAMKDANDNDALFKYLIITQCNALSFILPGMFQKIDDYTELLFPDNLLREGSAIEQMISLIPEDDWKDQVQIIGWLYQYYNEERKREVINIYSGTVKKEDIPAATQLFTTDWVVRYMVDNSLGRYWIERNPNSKLRNKLEFFVSPKSSDISYVDEKINPTELTFFDPCMGSGHILVYAFDVLMDIYREYGYSDKDAALSIVENNLFGLDIDDRAYQLAYFAVMMKARSYNRRALMLISNNNLCAIQESNGIAAFVCDGITEDKEQAAIGEYLIDLFRDAKELGSLISIESRDYDSFIDYLLNASPVGQSNIFHKEWLEKVKPLCLRLAKQAVLLGKKYCVVATNPPYLGKMQGQLKQFVANNYKDYSGDLFSVFMYRNFDFCVKNGYSAFMTPFVWMFIKTYEKLREYIIGSKGITTLIQMEYSAFEEATVPICSFVLKNGKSEDKSLCIKLSDFKGGMEVQKNKVLEALRSDTCRYFYAAAQCEFGKIPGSPVAYWVSESGMEKFETMSVLSDYIETKQGFKTGNNDLFLRLWFEIESHKFSIINGKKWFPCNKGGDYRKWYGNFWYVVNWENDGILICNYRDEKGKLMSRPQNLSYNFKEGLTWTSISSGPISLRYSDNKMMFESKGSGAFAKSGTNLLCVQAFLNSVVGMYYIKALAPTLDYSEGSLLKLPYDGAAIESNLIAEKVKENIRVSKQDWDSFETSWDFARHPLVRPVSNIADAYTAWQCECDDRFNQLKSNEEELNRIFIDIYGLRDELTPEVEDKDVTVRKADLQRDIKSLISYAVGCMFGRYSLDTEGLVFAGGEWNGENYMNFPADNDNIIPISDDDYFGNDDIVNRFVEFIRTVYGEQSLEQNLKFIADALGGKGQPKDVIRNYFLNDFYADHLKIYQKRPIYWLFDSGKKNGFKCLIYMHRYQPDTIARIRTDYVHEQQSRYRTAIEELEKRIASASTGDKVKLTKQLSKLQDQAAELHEYEEKIHHLADQYISIDLDDGVKVNYAKFQDVLAKIK